MNTKVAAGMFLDDQNGIEDDGPLSAGEAAESESAWRSYLAGDDPGATIEEVRRKLLGEEDA